MIFLFCMLLCATHSVYAFDKKRAPTIVVTKPPSLLDSDEWEQVGSSPVTERFKKELHKKVESRRKKMGGTCLDLGPKRLKHTKVTVPDVAYMYHLVHERFSFSREQEREWLKDPELQYEIPQRVGQSERLKKINIYMTHRQDATLLFLCDRFNERDMQARICAYLDLLALPTLSEAYTEAIIEQLFCEFKYEILENLAEIARY